MRKDGGRERKKQIEENEQDSEQKYGKILVIKKRNREKDTDKERSI